MEDNTLPVKPILKPAKPRFSVKIRNKITGLSGLLCYFQRPSKIGCRSGNKQVKGRQTTNILVRTFSGEMPIR
jgi:hypothetical protein